MFGSALAAPQTFSQGLTLYCPPKITIMCQNGTCGIQGPLESGWSVQSTGTYSSGINSEPLIMVTNADYPDEYGDHYRTYCSYGGQAAELVGYGQKPALVSGTLWRNAWDDFYECDTDNFSPISNLQCPLVPAPPTKR